MTIFALEQCVENGVDLNISDAESALAELNTLRDQLAEAQSERDSLRTVVEFCKHKATGMRIWGGMGWVYHPPQAKEIFDAANSALSSVAIRAVGADD